MIRSMESIILFEETLLNNYCVPNIKLGANDAQIMLLHSFWKELEDGLIKLYFEIY